MNKKERKRLKEILEKREREGFYSTETIDSEMILSEFKNIMANENKDKAKKIHDVIYETLNSCGGDCKKCVLQDICDDLDILTFKLFQKY